MFQGFYEIKPVYCHILTTEFVTKRSNTSPKYFERDMLSYWVNSKFGHSTATKVRIRYKVKSLTLHFLNLSSLPRARG